MQLLFKAFLFYNNNNSMIKLKFLTYSLNVQSVVVTMDQVGTCISFCWSTNTQIDQYPAQPDRWSAGNRTVEDLSFC